MKNAWMIAVARERAEQVYLHGHTEERDVQENTDDQLIKGAVALVEKDYKPALSAEEIDALCPAGWNLEGWRKMYNKERKERTIKACALLAAQIDLIENIELVKTTKTKRNK